MINYNNGKIYKIICKTTNNIYIGSTCNTLKQRLNEHKSCYKRFKLNKQNTYNNSSFKILENNNYEIQLIENYQCNNKKELLERERFYIIEDNCINKYIPTRTNKEYREDNKEYYKKYNKEYQNKNKENLKIQHKIYYENNKINWEKYKKKYSCYCGSEIQEQEKARHNKSKKHLSFITK